MSDQQSDEYPGLLVRLYKHQKVSISKMEELERTKTVRYHYNWHTEFMIRMVSTVSDPDTEDWTNRVPSQYQCTAKVTFGYLADLPGYGKSYSVLGLIARDRMPWPLDETHLYPIRIADHPNSSVLAPHYTANLYNHCNFDARMEVPFRRLNCNLLVCPASCVMQWKEYLSNTGLKYDIVKTNAAAAAVDPRQLDVVVVAPNFFNNLLKRFRGWAWKRFIMDDPVNIHIVHMEYVVAGFTWYIAACINETGIPYHGADWVSSQFHLWRYHGLSAVVIRNDDDFVKSSFRAITINVKKYTCFNPVQTVLSEFLPNTIAELMAAGDTKGAIKALSVGQVETDDIIKVIDLRFDKEEHDLRARIRDEAGPSSKKTSSLEDQLKALTARRADMHQRLQWAMEHPCAICSDDMTAPSMTPCCMHVFCEGCITSWLRGPGQGKCPMCRTAITTSVRLLPSGEKKSIERVRQKSKPEQALEIMRDAFARDGRVLLFSSSVATFDIIHGFMQEAGIPYKEVKGTVAQRAKTIENYKTGKIKVLFLNWNFNGAGINLQETTDIVLFHPISDQAMYNQVIGRAVRVGKEDDVTVHVLE